MIKRTLQAGQFRPENKAGGAAMQATRQTRAAGVFPRRLAVAPTYPSFRDTEVRRMSRVLQNFIEAQRSAKS